MTHKCQGQKHTNFFFNPFTYERGFILTQKVATSRCLKPTVKNKV